MIKKITVRDLASRAGKELDETLILLWDNGIENVIDISSILNGSDIKEAFRVLGIPTRRELTSKIFWQKMFRLSEEDFTLLLDKLNISIIHGSKSLPKNSVKKLKAEAEKRNIPQVKFFIQPPVLTFKKCPPETEFKWKIIGKKKELHHLSYDEIVAIHEALAKDFATHNDPISPPGIKDKNLLHSAVFRPLTSNGDDFKYPTAEMSASALLYSIIHNHPFYNGNKRTALVSMLALLDANGLTITCNEDLLFKFVLQVAQHKIVKCNTDNFIDKESQYISKWIHENSRNIETGERSIPFRKLRRILTKFECIFDQNDNKIIIQREVKRTKAKSWFFFSKEETVTLKTQIAYHSDGRAVGRNIINKIRDALQLNESAGVDSITFYEKSNEPIDTFIALYAKTLKRLSKL